MGRKKHVGRRGEANKIQRLFLILQNKLDFVGCGILSEVSHFI